MGTHVSAEQITFENAAGERTIIKLSSLTGSGPKPKDRNGLLLWGVFYQLVELNQRLGHFDQKEMSGSGITGMLAQLRGNDGVMLERLGKLVEVMEGLAAQAAAAQANAPTPQAAMNQAMELMRNLSSTQPPPGATSGEPSGGNGAGD